MSYYDDDDKLTYDQAEDLLERYIEEYHDQRASFNACDVLDRYDYPRSHHNILRLTEFLQKQCQTIGNTSPTRYKMPDP